MSRGRTQPSLLAGMAGLAGVALVLALRRDRHRSAQHALPRQTAGPRSREIARAGRRLDLSSALLSFSVLADSGLEHYRGSFQNRAMFVPLATSALTLGGSLFGVLDRRTGRHFLRDGIYAGAAATGFAGFGFHAYNIGKRPGGLSWENFFYSAPIGAPIAMTLAGLLGRGAENVRDAAGRPDGHLLGEPLGPLLAGVSAVGLLGTVGEVALLHFRGAYHNPAMYLPIIAPPASAALLAYAARSQSDCSISIARWALRATAALGVIGVGFHAFGVARNMGGWRNWSQNILNGPPLPAPPSFTGLAISGLASLDLVETHRRG